MATAILKAPKSDGRKTRKKSSKTASERKLKALTETRLNLSCPRLCHLRVPARLGPETGKA
jgi:hypothetical protein